MTSFCKNSADQLTKAQQGTICRIRGMQWYHKGLKLYSCKHNVKKGSTTTDNHSLCKILADQLSYNIHKEYQLTLEAHTKKSNDKKKNDRAEHWFSCWFWNLWPLSDPSFAVWNNLVRPLLPTDFDWSWTLGIVRPCHTPGRVCKALTEQTLS
jgi:hypothetical protein